MVELRAADAEDTQMVMKWFNDPRTRSKMPISPIPTSVSAQRELLELNGSGDYVLFIVEHSELGAIGLAGLHQIDPQQSRARSVTVIGEAAALQRGNGAAARELVLSFGFSELNLQKVVGGALACNLPAASLLSRKGAVLEGFRQREYFRHGSWHDFVEFARYNDRESSLASRIQPLNGISCSCGVVESA